MPVNPLSEWQNFYVIVGSAGAALTGLQFVTMALIADMPLGEEESDAGAAFSTPSIVHFGTVLLLAAALVMPWRGVTAAMVILGGTGLIGVGYTSLAGWRMREQQSYAPVLEDWVFRFVLPLIAYGGLATSACATRFALRPGLFGVAFVVLLLLFIGIHNAWDNVTYLVFVKRRKEKAASQKGV